MVIETDEETLWEFVRRLEERIEAVEQGQQWLDREVSWLKKEKSNTQPRQR